MKRLLSVLILFALTAPGARAAAIFVGQHDLLPNQPNQTIPIFVTGGDAVQGMNLYVQIADGGPPAGGTVDGPKITDVDVLTGAIFASNHKPLQTPPSLPQLVARVVVTQTGAVSADGLLATITLDTTGFTEGSWSLNLGNTQNGPSDFTTIPLVQSCDKI